MPKNSQESHRFHLVDPSPWPILTGLAALQLVLGFVLYFNYYSVARIVIALALGQIMYYVGSWFVDIIVESTYQGNHTEAVVRGLRYGMALFIVSEVMFFFSFFWAFFHFSLSPSIWIGCVWPPQGVIKINPYAIPLFNTVVLLCSGVFLVYAHSSIVAGEFLHATWGLVFTIIYGLIFISAQFYEYVTLPLSIDDGAYGSAFFLLTGFHGLHVVAGLVMLSASLYRLQHNQLLQEQHLGFEFAAWYWHFVDVVWLFLFIFVYIWGGL